MMKRGERLTLPLEALAELILLSEVSREDFKGDGLAVSLTFVDLTHATFADHVQHIIRAQFTPRQAAGMGDGGVFLGSGELVQVEVEPVDAAVYEPLHLLACGIKQEHRANQGNPEGNAQLCVA